MPVVSHQDVYEHAQAVRRFLHGRLSDRTSIDDATQETFARALSRRRTLREEEKLVPWLLGIARLVSFEHQRRSKRFAELADQEDGLEDEAANPEATLVGRETEAAVGQALLSIDRERREALMMRVDRELGYDEIAESMGWSIAKVKNEIHRARVQLRALLAMSLCLLGLSVWLGSSNIRSTPSEFQAGEYGFCAIEGALCADLSADMIAAVEAEHLACLDATPATLPDRSLICR